MFMKSILFYGIVAFLVGIFWFLTWGSEDMHSPLYLMMYARMAYPLLLVAAGALVGACTNRPEHRAWAAVDLVLFLVLAPWVFPGWSVSLVGAGSLGQLFLETPEMVQGGLAVLDGILLGRAVRTLLPAK